jgi:hypothetical protein
VSFKIYNYGVEIPATINEAQKTARVVVLPNTQYSFTVKAFVDPDLSAASNVFPVMSLPLGAVTNISHTIVDGAIHLTWTASPDAAAYKVYYKTHAGGTYDGAGLHFNGIPATSSPIPAEFASLDMTDPQHPIAKLHGVDSNSTYHFGVSVINGTSEGSVLDYATPVSVVLVPPTNLVVATEGAAVKLTWTPGIGDTATEMWRYGKINDDMRKTLILSHFRKVL